jgi:hypothetical protein
VKQLQAHPLNMYHNQEFESKILSPITFSVAPEPAGTSLCLQKPATDLYPEPV